MASIIFDISSKCFKNKAIPVAELGIYVKNLVKRILSFDKQALNTCKSIINQVGLPNRSALQTTEDTLFTTFGWEGARECAPKLRERGIGKAGNFESNLGKELGNL